MTTNEGKVYSNGLALQLYANLSLEEITQINKNVVALLQRVLTFPMVTVAAINGVCCACVCVCARALATCTIYWESFTEENIREFCGFWNDRECFLAAILYLNYLD